MTFEAYLVSKKIDSPAFEKAETNLFQTWKTEFEQMHPDSFTAQKLYLINPVRRKYTLKEVKKIEGDVSVNETKTETLASSSKITEQQSSTPSAAAPSPDTKPAPAAKPARPVFKPRPKIN